MSKSTESISKGINIVMKKPVLFAPYVIPIAIHVIFIVLSYVFAIRYTLPHPLPPYYTHIEVPNPYIAFIGSFIAEILGFIAGCMLVDMANDAINERAIDLRKSFNLVISRIGVLIVTAIIATIFSIIIILLPVALFLMVIAIIEGQDAVESIKEAFSFVTKNLGEVIIFVVIVIIVSAIVSLGFSFIPVVGSYIGAILFWLLHAMFTVSSVYLYLSLKLPPPPPPPPPPSEIST